MISSSYDNVALGVLWDKIVAGRDWRVKLDFHQIGKGMMRAPSKDAKDRAA